MNFIGREIELKTLYEEQALSQSGARFTIIMGRRRIGKTRLIQKSLEGQQFLYLLAKNEGEESYCSRVQRQITEELNIPIFGTLSNMRDVFQVLFSYATQTHLNIVIDEIQEFFYVRKSIFADMQEMWDKYKNNMHINLITCGSIYSLMRELFEDRKQAMYGRYTRRIDLKGFTTAELKQIMDTYYPQHTPEDTLCLYTLTGGVPKYVETFVDNHTLTKTSMLRSFCDTSKLFVNEGSDLMNLEFRRESGMYYSILSLIADGKNTTGELESVLKTTTSAYLKNLEINYSLIEKRRPLFASERSQGIHYNINDNYMLTWMRFIYPYQNLISNGRSDKLISIIESGYQQFAGQMLERWFMQKYAEQGNYTQIGQWWDSKGGNEIDLIALDATTHTATIAEVKINKHKISMPALQAKADKLHPHLKRYTITFIALSLENM